MTRHVRITRGPYIGASLSEGFQRFLILVGLVAGWPKQKAQARPDFVGEVRPQRSPVRVGGLGGREGATQQPKRIFCTLSTIYHMMQDKFARKFGGYC